MHHARHIQRVCAHHAMAKRLWQLEEGGQAKLVQLSSIRQACTVADGVKCHWSSSILCLLHSFDVPVVAWFQVAAGDPAC